MKVTVKLVGTLSKYLPENADGTEIEVELNGNATIATLIEHLGFPAQQGYLLSVNGEMVPASERDSFVLQETDRVSIIPPLKGG